MEKDLKMKSQMPEAENKQKIPSPKTPSTPPSPPKTENIDQTPNSTDKTPKIEKEDSLEINREFSSESEKRKKMEEQQARREEENDILITRYKKMKGGRRKHRSEAEYSGDVDILKEKIQTAIKADNQCIMNGEFGGHKLNLLPTLAEKLSNKVFLQYSGFF